MRRGAHLPFMNRDTADISRPEIKGMNSEEIAARLEPIGADARTARRIQGAIFRTGEFPRSLPEISDRLLSEASRLFSVSSLECAEKAVSQEDGFVRYLFRAPDGAVF